jgi:hypothetical protein
MKYRKGVISFFDILGFRNLIKVKKYSEMKDIMELFEKCVETGSRANNGKKELKIYKFSDNISRVWVEKEAVERGPIIQGEIECILSIIFSLFLKKIFIRGGITVGAIEASKSTVYGGGLNRAYELENNIAVYPRVIIDPELIQGKNEDGFKYLKKDLDGYFFVNYMERLVEFEDDFLSVHKNIISEQLLNTNNDEKTLQKYKWLKEYHNNFILETNGLNEDEFKSKWCLVELIKKYKMNGISEFLIT